MQAASIHHRWQVADPLIPGAAGGGRLVRRGPALSGGGGGWGRQKSGSKHATLGHSEGTALPARPGMSRCRGSRTRKETGMWPVGIQSC